MYRGISTLEFERMLWLTEDCCADFQTCNSRILQVLGNSKSTIPAATSSIKLVESFVISNMESRSSNRPARLFLSSSVCGAFNHAPTAFSFLSTSIHSLCGLLSSVFMLCTSVWQRNVSSVMWASKFATISGIHASIKFWSTVALANDQTCARFSTSILQLEGVTSTCFVHVDEQEGGEYVLGWYLPWFHKCNTLC